MKKLYFVSLAALSILAASCSEFQQDELPNEGSIVARAIMEEVNDKTKAVTDDEGSFTWSKGDAITAWSDAGAAVKMTTSDEGTSEATFTSTGMVSGKLGTIAVSPYNENHKYSNNSLTVHLPSEYGSFDEEYVLNTWSPMLAYDASVTPSTSPTFEFNHLCGLVRFNVNNVPAETAQFQFEAADKDICGDFSVDLAATEKVINAVEKTSKNIVTLKFKPSDAARDMKFFIPLPVGEYNGLTLRLLKEDGTEVSSYTSTKTNTMKRRTLALFVDLSIPTGTGIIESTTAGKLRNIAKNGGSITLDDDVIMSEMINIVSGKKVEIDLGGHKLTNSLSGDAWVLGVTPGAQLIIKGEGTIDSGNCWGAIKIAGNGGDQPAKLVVEGGTIIGQYYGIVGNGTEHNTEIEVNGGKITARYPDDNYGIFNPQNGKITVNGGEIEGTTGIELRSGTLIIKDGLVKSNATSFKKQKNNSGTTIWGAAVAVSQHNTDKDINVEISGGTFESRFYALYEEDLQNKNVDNIKMSVTSGTFQGGVYSENNPSFIKGGTFSDPATLNYLTSDADVEVLVPAGSYKDVYKATTGKAVIKPAVEGETVVIAGINAQSNNTTADFTFEGITFDNSLQTSGWFTGTAQNIYPCVGIWGGSYSFNNCKFIVDGGSGKETGVMTWWTTIDCKVKLSFTGCSFEGKDNNAEARAMQIYDHVNLDVDNCTFTTAKRYALKYAANEGFVANIKNCKVSNCQYIVELGSSEYPGNKYTVNFVNNELASGVNNYKIANEEGATITIDGVTVAK